MRAPRRRQRRRIRLRTAAAADRYGLQLVSNALMSHKLMLLSCLSPLPPSLARSKDTVFILPAISPPRTTSIWRRGPFHQGQVSQAAAAKEREEGS